MTRILAAAVAAAACAAFAGAAQASLTTASSPLALGADDHILWDQLGPDLTMFATPVTVHSVNLEPGIVVNAASGDIQHLVAGSSWGGNIQDGTDLIRNSYELGGAISITFPHPVFGVGALFEPQFFGEYQFEIHVDGDGGHAFVDIGQMGPGDGPFFIGVLSSIADINTVTFNLLVDGNDDYAENPFVLGPVAFQDGPVGGGGGCLGGACPPPDTWQGAPEPAAWALMVLGFAGAGAGLRRRRGEVAAAR
jgi:hypothetical protein